MRKKSYMNTKIVSKGIKLEESLKTFMKRLKKLQKMFRDEPEIKKRISHINKDAAEIAKWYKKKFGKDVPKDFFI